MKFLAATAALAGLLPTAYAHYWFDVLVIEGQETGPYEYVRQSTRASAYNPIKWTEMRDDSSADSDDIRCNQGHFSSAGSTGVADVAAGSRVALKLAAGGDLFHPGPGLAYLSRAPGSVQDYQGDGDWFKIFDEGVCNEGADFTADAWCNFGADRIEFNIPSDTPDGEYLLRVEHIGVHRSHVDQPEFYVSCAQIRVTGGGNGQPGPTVQFPGAYQPNHPAFYQFSVYGGPIPFEMPGPAVWS